MTANSKKSVQLSDLKSSHNEALIELESYKLLVESVEDYAIFMLDPNGIVMSWNKGAETTKGYKPHEIIGKHFSAFYLQRDIDNKKPEKELRIAKKFGRVEDEDWRIRKDGTKFWANVIITALYNDEKKLVGFAKITRNLTERKRHEDEQSNANILLKQQQEELKILNKSKDEFISLASHQLRTPATAVKQMLGLLLEGFQGEMSDNQLQTVRKAYESNDRQISIVNSLLNVAQLDSGKVTLEKTSLVIDDLLQDILEELSASFSARDQTVVYEHNNQTAKVEVDPKYFRMALENFIDNASKYTQRSGKIVVSTKIDNNEQTISIQDNGVGIAKKDLPRLFEKFNRISNDISQKVPGSGLGLYWAKEIISLHGGMLDVDSELGKGTTFTVRIPIRTADAQNIDCRRRRCYS